MTRCTEWSKHCKMLRNFAVNGSHAATDTGKVGMKDNEDPVSPANYPNPRNDDPWDNDAVRWLLLQDGGTKWTRGSLMEALRRQERLVRDQPRVVADAARFAARFGVRQVELPYGTRTITRLVRTDAKAPPYPADRVR